MNSLPLVRHPGKAAPEEVLCRPPREGLERLLVKMGRTGPLAELRRGPQAGKSGDPCSQNPDCIAGSRYLIGTPKEVYPQWSSEWFYMDDVPLPDPVWRGLPEFSSAPLKKCLNWRL